MSNSQQPPHSDNTTLGLGLPFVDDEAGLLDLLILLAQHKKLILGLPIGIGILTASITLLLPNIYTATTRILPPQNQTSASALLIQQLGGLATLAGGAAGLRNPSDLYIGMLKSRTVADNLIQRFELTKIYSSTYLSQTRSELENQSNISSGKDGIITIEVDDEDPKRAAQIANAYVDELIKLTKVLAVTEASQRRLFFERQLAEARNNLTAAEAAAREAIQSGGLVQIQGQGRAVLEAAARLRGQLAVKEVQIGAMRTFAAERNPELLLAQQELDAIKRELAKLEGATEGRSGTAKSKVGSGPDNAGLLRNVAYYETIFELLAKQFELAKIDEAKDATIVQIMDRAVEPDRKSKPKRGIIVLISSLVAGFLAISWVFIRHIFRNATELPDRAKRISLLIQYLGISRR